MSWSVCECSSLSTGAVCSGVQCSRMRWITRQPYGWVDSAYTCPTNALIMNCNAAGSTHSIHFCTWNYNNTQLTKQTRNNYRIQKVDNSNQFFQYNDNLILTTWFPFWSLTHLSTCPSSSRTTSCCCSAGMDSSAFWITRHPYICSASASTCPRT